MMAFAMADWRTNKPLFDPDYVELVAFVKIFKNGQNSKI